MSTPAGDGLVGNAVIRVDGDTDPAIRALRQLQRTADGRLRDLRGRFASESELIRRSLTRATGGGDRFSLSLRGIAGAAGRAGGALAAVAGPLARVGAAAGSAAPLLAAAVTTLQNVAPAGAVAVSGMLAVRQAAFTLQLGMMGVEDAVTAAFDTSAEGAEAFQEALENLSPSARAFAMQVRELAPAFQRFQQGVQNRLFIGLGNELGRLSKQVLPVVRTNFNSTATTLNRMALGASSAARELATSGTLGQALAGANTGLRNLRGIPGQIVTALGQLGAAGAPSLNRLTDAASAAATRISERLSSAFESGALQSSVETAVGLLEDLGRVGANVFQTIGNVIAPVQQQGGGLIGILLEITGALREATATTGFQDAIGALAGVMGTLARTVGPLLGQALAAIGPVFTTLGPPVERLVENLGSALSPVIDALGPVLESAAGAVSALVDAMAPLLPVIGGLVADLLPSLTPLFDALREIFEAFAPSIRIIGDILGQTLSPILAALPELIRPLLTVFTELAEQQGPLLADLLTQLQPSFVQIGMAVGELLVALGPLIGIVAQLATGLLTLQVQAFAPLIPVIAKVIAEMARLANTYILGVLVPAIQALVALLRGDLSGALDLAGTAFRNWNKLVLKIFAEIPLRASTAIASLANKLASRAREAMARFLSEVLRQIGASLRALRALPGQASSALRSLTASMRDRAVQAGRALLDAIRERIGAAVDVVRGLPGRARSALGGVGSTLYGAGQDLVQGMINGVRDKAQSLVSAAQDVVGSAINGAKSLLGISSPSKVFAEIGRNTGLGFIRGLTGTREQIRSTARDLARAIRDAFRGEATRVDDILVEMLHRGNARLQVLAKEREQLSARIQRAQKTAADITQAALGFAALSTTGGQRPTVPGIKKDLQLRLQQIKGFNRNVRKLAKLGLRRDLLQQILQLGPEQGAQYARALAEGGKQGVKEVNRLQAQISKSSRGLGKFGADALFDAGKNAGKGFLAGLRGQRKQIEKLMLQIARGMQKAIRKALGIKSPSKVMAEVGRDSVLGLQEGITRGRPLVERAMARIADAVATAVPARVPAGNRAQAARATEAVARTLPGARQSVTVINNINLTNRGVLGSPFEVREWLTRALDNAERTGRLPRALARGA